MSRGHRPESCASSLGAGRRIARLTLSDLSALRYETQAAPMHIGALVVLEAAPLLDAGGRLRLEEVRRRIELRLPRVPVLRQRLFSPGPFQGRPLWVDDADFDIAVHVRETVVDSPGEGAELLVAAERLMGVLLDRGRPLWELWFITGLSGDRVGVMVKLHHAIADGRAAVAMMGSLFDVSPEAPDPEPSEWVPAPAPSSWALFTDNLSARIRAMRQAARMLAHPSRAAAAVRAISGALLRGARGAAAPRSSINRPVAAGRRVRFARFDLAALKATAHAAGGKVNDVVLDLAAGALSELLLSRGERLDGVELIASMPVSLRRPEEAQDTGNAIGVIAVPLPVGETDAGRRLELIVASSRQAKQEQHPKQVEAFVAWIAATPIAQRFISRQRLINTEVTNVAGPPVPAYVLGARIRDLVPIVSPAGNVTISFCAFSYAGCLYLVATADATSTPDVDRLIIGAQNEWEELSTGQRERGRRDEYLAQRAESPAGRVGANR
jgi:diacylglycerol O-acyltransferase / wax synthase